MRTFNEILSERDMKVREVELEYEKELVSARIRECEEYASIIRETCEGKLILPKWIGGTFNCSGHLYIVPNSVGVTNYYDEYESTSFGCIFVHMDIVQYTYDKELNYVQQRGITISWEHDLKTMLDYMVENEEILEKCKQYLSDLKAEK